MLLDIHCHSSRHSACSSVSPAELVHLARRKALQGIVITEHHYLWSDEELLALRAESEIENHFVLLAGQEVSTDAGHVLVYGAPESIRAGTALGEIRARFPEAALVLAHPYRSERAVPEGGLLNPALDAVEIFSGNHTVRQNCRGLMDWHRLKFTAVSGTDAHGRSPAAVYPCQFDHPVRTVADLAAEIRAGRCRPFLKEIPKAGASLEILEITIGTKGEDESRPRIVFRSYDSRGKWERAQRAFDVMEALYLRGFDAGPFRVPAPIDRDPATRTLIEEGMRGASLYDRLKASPPRAGGELLSLAARWLARLHALRLRVTEEGEFIPSERKRLARYAAQFSRIGHPLAGDAAAVGGEVLRREERIVSSSAPPLARGHGDYHPKNVFIGRDRADDGESRFASAIDFASSRVAPPAFDVGCFLAQYANQCAGLEGVLAHSPPSLFLEAYRSAAEGLPPDFDEAVRLFRARADLGIASYLISVGKGDSADLQRVMGDAKEALGA